VVLGQLKIKAIIIDNKLYIENDSLIKYILDEINSDMRRPGKTYSKFAKKIINILNKFNKSVDKYK